MSVHPPLAAPTDSAPPSGELRPIHNAGLQAQNAVHAAPRVRVLVVDDHPDCAETLGMALDFFGYEVRICHSGMEGLAAAECLAPAFAVVDLGLPDISGYELARQITRAPWGKGIQLIAVTGWGTADDHRDADAAGFRAKFVKPLEFSILDATLRNMLSA